MRLSVAFVIGVLMTTSSNAQKSKGPVITFHHCTYGGGSSNIPHLFDASKIYHCDEGDIEVAGQWNQTIERGYLYESEMGEPKGTPRPATADDYAQSKWCSTPKPWDVTHKERCGDKPIKCFDGKLATWDKEWRGYSCVTPDHAK
jgi:hypothetical protein